MDFVWWCMQQLKTNSLNSTLHQIKLTVMGVTVVHKNRDKTSTVTYQWDDK